MPAEQDREGSQNERRNARSDPAGGRIQATSGARRNDESQARARPGRIGGLPMARVKLQW